MSFSRAMQPGQPPQAAPGPQQPNPLVAEMQQVTASVQALIRKLKSLPGINHQVFEQGVALMTQGTTLIGQAMPKGQGPGAQPPQR